MNGDMHRTHTVKSYLAAMGLLLTLTGGSAFGQNLGGSGYQLDAYDVRGRVFTSTSNEEEANPMLNLKWGKGMVQFSNNFWVKEMDLQFNLAVNELYFRKNDQVYTFADSIREFMLVYADENTSRMVRFRSGYPPQGKCTNATFYEVLADGNRLQLLDYRTKNLQVINNYGEGTKKVYKEIHQLFWYEPLSRRLVKAQRDAAILKQEFPELASRVDALFQEKKFRLRNEEELVEFMNRLNK